MAFDDNPIVDNNSLLSEDSILKVRSIFTKRNGFIIRIDDPDYGVDVDLELIENGGATSKKIAIQIKSSSDLKYIDKGQVISLSFNTSRLGYLSSRPPAYGIVVVHDNNKNEAFYEYVENIIFKLKDDRKSDDWKNQASVSIHIPVLNVLNEVSAKQIHQKALARHNSLNALIAAHGEAFDIPNLSDKQFKFNTTRELAESLEKNGSLLVNNMEFDLLQNLLDQLPFGTIVKSNKLIMLSAISTIEIGNFIDATYFISKAISLEKEYSYSEFTAIKFSKAKLDFAMGEIDFEEFHDVVYNLLQVTPKGDVNYLVLKINLIYSKVNALFKRNSRLEPTSRNELLELFKEIEDSKIDDRIKHFLLIYHSENFDGYALKEYITKTGEFQMKDNLGLIEDYQENIPIVKEILNLIHHSEDYYKNALECAKETNDQLLLATAMEALASHNFSIHFQIAVFRKWKLEEGEETRNVFQSNFNWAFSSFDLFKDLNRVKDAFRSLSCAYNIKRLYKKCFEVDLAGISLDEIRSILNSISMQTGISSFISPVDQLIQKAEGISNTWDFNDEEIDSFADAVIKVYELPTDRREHVKNDIKAHKFFKDNYKGDKILLHQDLTHKSSKATHYASPCKYILINKETGIRSLPKTDLVKLMNDWNLI